MHRATRREFLRAATLGGAAAVLPQLTGPAAAAGPAAQPPNVLFILVDQLTLGAMGCAGHPQVRTPNLDRLAAGGMRFAKSYCTYPLCSPSRASLFTSRMPHEVGVNSNQNAVLPADVPTMGELFGAAGYQTAYAGKWHLPAPYPAYARGPRQQEIRGFTVLPMEGTMLAKDELAKGKGLTYDPRAVAAAVRFLEEPHAKPFLLVVSILNPHDICEFPEISGPNPVLARRPAPPPPPPNPEPGTQEPSVLENVRRRGAQGKSLGDWTDDQWLQMRAVYHSLVEFADAQVGRVLDALGKAGLAANTLVVFTSDHGEMLGSHRLIHKQQLYDEAATVPLVVRAPGQTRPAVDGTHLVSGLDVMPTVLDYAGIALPASLEGRSLRPLVERREVAWRDGVFSEVGEAGGRWGRMLRTARHKYVVYAQGENREQLFDMDADPGEMRNLAAEPAARAVLEDHRRRLADWQQATRDTFPAGGTSPAQGPGAAKARTEAEE